MFLGVRSTAGKLVRRTVAIGVLFGVLVAPVEASLPDVHDVAVEAVTAIMTIPGQAVNETASSVAHIESQHACNPAVSPDGCPSQGQSGGTGYDHCMHSHVAQVAYAAIRPSTGSVRYAAYAQPERQPASFRASPAIRPPIA